MKKVLVVFDGEHFPSATLDFALELNSREPIMLTGIFLPSADYAEVMSYTYYGNAIASFYPEAHVEDAVAIKRNIGLFEVLCKEHHIRYKVHHDIQNKLAKGLQRETRYADLLVLSSTHFFENLGEQIQEEYLADTLHKTECPVVLLPGVYTRPDSVIFAYDGSASSLHAIKQFIYLFPQFADLDVLVMYADDHEGSLPSLSLIKEYAGQHFSRLSYYKLNTDPKKHIDTWLKNKGATIVVSGAYGRSAFSEFFRRNFLKDVVRAQLAPLFIAHL